jgi:L-iditol 2-dehydrogenase
VTRSLFDPQVVAAGDRVLVTGPGTMGLLTAQVAQALGGDVVVAGLPRDQHRLEVARTLELGTHEITSTSPLPEGAFDVVCECSGAAAAASSALAAVAKQGHYTQVGIFGTPIVFDLDTVLYKELTLTSGNASTPTSWRRAVQLLSDEAVQLDPLVTAVVPLAEWPRAFASTRSGEGIKYLIDPRPSA